MFTIRNLKFKGILDIPELTLDRPVTCILGPSGSGKSTLLKMLNRLVEPDSGTIEYNGQLITEMPPAELRRRVSMLGQTPVLYGGTLAEELSLPSRFGGYPPPTEAEMNEALRDAGLDKPLAMHCGSYSGGEKQRACFARLLLTRAETYLLDEPTAALDKATELRVMSRMGEICREKGRQMIVVTHSPEVSALFSDSIVRIVAGRTNGYEA